jgi:hypothetical protein
MCDEMANGLVSLSLWERAGVRVYGDTSSLTLTLSQRERESFWIC